MEAKSNPFDAIPLEVLENIFERTYLKFLASLCLVCKRWNEVFADQSGIWRLMFNTKRVKCNADYKQSWRPKVMKLAKILSSFKVEKTFEYSYMTERHTPNPNHSFHLLSDYFIIADGSLMTIIDLTYVEAKFQDGFSSDLDLRLATAKPLKNPVSFFSGSAIREYVRNARMTEQLAAQPDIITEYPFQPVMYYGRFTDLFDAQNYVQSDGKQQLFIFDDICECVVWDQEEFRRGMKSYRFISGGFRNEDRNCLAVNSKYVCALTYYENEGQISMAKVTEKCCPRGRLSASEATISPPRCVRCQDDYQPVNHVEKDLGPIQCIYAMNSKPDIMLFFFADKLGAWRMVSEGSLEIFNYLESGASLSLIKFDGPQDFSNVRSISDHTTEINSVKRYFLGFTCRENTTIIIDLKDPKHRITIESTQFKWVPNHNKVAAVKSDSIDIYDLDQKIWQISIKTLDGFVDLTFDPTGKIMFLANKEQQCQVYHWETGALITTIDDVNDLKHVFCFNDVLVVVTYTKAKVFKIWHVAVGSLNDVK